MEFILRFTFTNPDLDTMIVGTVNPAHLQANLDPLEHGPLSPDLYDEGQAPSRRRRVGPAQRPPMIDGPD
jgi:aryl-alcohol dehydrogenase-like predicted oxidoreductase